MKFNVVQSSAEPFVALIYGTTGVGKTTLSGTALDHEDMRDVLFVDYDGGLASISHRQDGVKSSITGLSDISQLNDLLTVAPEKRPEEIRAVKTVIVDSLSAMRDAVLSESAKRGFQTGGKGRTDEYTLQMQDYNKMGGVIGTFLQNVRNYGYNLIMLAGERETTGDAGIVGEVVPDLNPSIRNKVMHLSSYVWRIAKNRDGERGLAIVNGPGKHWQKTRGVIYESKLRSIANESGYMMLPAISVVDGVATEKPVLPLLFDLHRGDSLAEAEKNYNFSQW